MDALMLAMDAGEITRDVRQDETMDWLQVPAQAHKEALELMTSAVDGEPAGTYLASTQEPGQEALAKRAGAQWDVCQYLASVGLLEPQDRYYKLAQLTSQWFKRDVRQVEQVEQPGYSDKQADQEAFSHTLRGLGEAAGYFPGGRYSWSIPGVPRELTGTLAGGLLGAGVGYGAGYLGEHLLPERWQRGNMRRTLATMGGLAGAAPGLVNMGVNKAQGKPWSDSQLWDTSTLANPPQPWGMGEGAEGGKSGAADHTLVPIPSSPRTHSGENKNTDVGAFAAELAPQLKAAIAKTGDDMNDSWVPVDEFHETIWNDPRVSGRLSMPMRAAATGLVESAYQARGGTGMRLVSPMDIGRIAAGMGSGYLSGALVGKALGVLMGMPTETQDRLKQIGLFSGVVANVVPLAFNL